MFSLVRLWTDYKSLTVSVVPRKGQTNAQVVTRFKLITSKLHWLPRGAGAVEYTNCTSAEGYPPMSVLDLTQNDLMVRFQ